MNHEWLCYVELYISNTRDKRKMNLLSNILIGFHRMIWKIPFKRYSRFQKFPKVEQSDWQGKKTYLMQTRYDCETVAIMNATEGRFSYKSIEKALRRVTHIGFVENPLFGNPWNVEKALNELGIMVEEIKPAEIKRNDSVIILLHECKMTENPFRHIFFQHWIAHSPDTETNEWHYGNGIKIIEMPELIRRWSCLVYPKCFRIMNNEERGGRGQ